MDPQPDLKFRANARAESRAKSARRSMYRRPDVDGSSGSRLDRIDGGLPRPWPADHEETSFSSDFYRLGDHFRWVIPAGVGFLVLVPGTALAGIARCAAGASPWAGSWEFCLLSASSTVVRKLPLEFWSALLLSGGLAVQSARLVGRPPRSFLWLVRRLFRARRRCIGDLL